MRFRREQRVVLGVSRITEQTLGYGAVRVTVCVWMSVPPAVAVTITV